jgi:hypothetical protein
MALTIPHSAFIAAYYDLLLSAKPLAGFFFFEIAQHDAFHLFDLIRLFFADNFLFETHGIKVITVDAPGFLSFQFSQCTIEIALVIERNRLGITLFIQLGPTSTSDSGVRCMPDDEHLPFDLRHRPVRGH